MPHPIGSMHTHRQHIRTQITVVLTPRPRDRYRVLSFYHLGPDSWRDGNALRDERTFLEGDMIPILDERGPYA